MAAAANNIQKIAMAAVCVGGIAAFKKNIQKIAMGLVGAGGIALGIQKISTTHITTHVYKNIKSKNYY